jgi:hypothetical protein
MRQILGGGEQVRAGTSPISDFVRKGWRFIAPMLLRRREVHRARGHNGRDVGALRHGREDRPEDLGPTRRAREARLRGAQVRRLEEGLRLLYPRIPGVQDTGRKPRQVRQGLRQEARLPDNHRR